MAIVRCPVCQRPFDTEKSPAMPFCSIRCQQVDLGRWLGEEHGLPTERDREGEEPGENGEP